MCIQTVNKHVIVLGKLSNVSNNRRILIKDMLGVIWAYGRRVRNNFICVVIFIEKLYLLQSVSPYQDSRF